MEQQSFYYPACWLVPEFDERELRVGPNYTINRLRFGKDTFELDTGQGFPPVLLTLEGFLRVCNLEICLRGFASVDEADAFLSTYRLALYSEVVTPFPIPWVGTISAGSRLMGGAPPVDMADLDHPVDYNFWFVGRAGSMHVKEDQFKAAYDKAQSWARLAQAKRQLKALQDAAIAAPRIWPPSQSLLHMWCGLESLFDLQQELSFRLSLCLATLIAPCHERYKIYKVAKESYALRSDVAHGRVQEVPVQDLARAWCLLIDAYNAIIRRDGLPKEEELLRELLT